MGQMVGIYNFNLCTECSAVVCNNWKQCSGLVGFDLVVMSCLVRSGQVRTG